MTGRFLKYVFGTYSVTGSSSYTHTMSAENDAYLPSVTVTSVEKETTNEIYDMLGCVFDQVTISWKKSSVVEVSANMIAQDIDDSSSSIPSISYPSDEPFSFKHVEVTVNSSSLVTNSGSITINNNHLAEGKCDSTLGRKIAQPQKGEVQYTISMNFDKTSTAQFLLWEGSTSHTVVIKFDRGTNDYIEFTFTNCEIDTLGEPIDLGANVIVHEGTWFPLSCALECKDTIAEY